MKVLEAATKPNAMGSYPSKAVHLEHCTGCGNCFEVCPDICITVYTLEDGEKE
jgi:2-oxoglutarate ferredoxin oxidoreductase subunit delta